MNTRTNPSHWDDDGNGREWSSDRGRGGGEGGRGYTSDQVYGQGTPMQRGRERERDQWQDQRDRSNYGRAYASPYRPREWEEDRWSEYRDDGDHWRRDFRESRQQSQGDSGDRYRRSPNQWGRDRNDHERHQDHQQWGSGFESRHPRFGESRLASYGNESYSLPDYFGTSRDSQNLARLRAGYRPDEESRRYADDRYGSPRSFGYAGYGGFGGFGLARTPSFQTGQTGYTGKGPKGYSRSDDRIRDDVCERLTYDPDIDASDVTVTVSQGEVTLAGEVEDRRAKRRAEDIIEDVSGVRDVHNQLRARRGFFGTVVAEMKGEEPSGESNVGKGPHAGTASVPGVKNGGSAYR